MNYLSIAVITLSFIGCLKTPEVELPEHIRDLENLTVYPGEAVPSMNISLTRDMTFGDSDEVLVGRITGVEVDSIGRVFLMDPTQTTLHVFSPVGRYIDSIGREGNGPGEFRAPTSMRVTAGQIHIYDAMLQRINVFSTDTFSVISTENLETGKIYGSTISSLSEEFKGLTFRGASYIRENTFLITVGPVYRTDPEHPLYNLEVERVVHYFILDNTDGSVSNKIFEQRDLVFLVGNFGSKNNRFNSFPFMSQSLRTISEDGYFYLAWADDFLIKIYSPEGDHIRSFYYPYENKPLTRNEALAMSSRPYDLELIQQSRLPETWPALQAIVIDDENRIWVSTIIDNLEEYEWWVLSPEGQLQAKFRWPVGRVIRKIKSGNVYARETDEETGIQTIARYRIGLEENR